MLRHYPYHLLLGVGLLLGACSGDDDDPDPTPTDSGVTPDSGVDAGTPDGGAVATTTFTLHFFRAGPPGMATYTGWTASLTGDAAEASVPVASVDDFGAVFEVPLSSGAQSFTYQLTDGTNTEAMVTVDVSGAADEGWHWQGAEEARLTAPPAVPTANQVLFYYNRCGGSYGEPPTQFGIYTWGEKAPVYAWPDREALDGIDDELGAWFLIDLESGNPADSCPPNDFCFIVQAGGDDSKDPAVDRGVVLADSGNQIFLITQDPGVFTSPPECGELKINGARAHIVTRDTVAWDVGEASAASYELRYSPTGDIALDGLQITGGTAIELTSAGGLSQAVLDSKPHLQGFAAFSIGALGQTTINEVLQSQLIAVAYDGSGNVVAATKVQIPGALDDLYPYDGPLGLDFSTSPAKVRLWAPTAQNVRFEVYDAQLNMTTTATMARDGATGVWSRDIDPAWVGGYYTYEVTVYHPLSDQIEMYSVTDPYATSLSTDSKHTQIIDVMNDPSTKPAGWDDLVKPTLEAPEDITIYELHVRDFSLADDKVDLADRGKFTAFLYNGTGTSTLSDGMNHLLQLQAAGLTHVHLLPAFDIATIEEDPANRVEITDGFDRLCMMAANVPADDCTQYGAMPIIDVLDSFGPSDEDQQQIVEYMKDLDGFNWGYDPFHYSVPEGSYSTDPMGAQRILEFRQMVQALADVGFRAALDVVYNHTSDSGPVSVKSVLDRIVPWYYHRLDPLSGLVVGETCCQDTATENRMMEKLMIDSVVFWAKAYKLDAFRFDLMGYHLKSHMVALRAALDGLTLQNDGVDGTEVYVYGEGWTPGIQGQQRGTPSSPNATQTELDGTGIGTFSDRLRDAARGGGPFDSGQSHVLNQGWLNGLAYDPNNPKDFGPSVPDRNPSNDANIARGRADWIRVGLAGNLQSYRLLSAADAVATGAQITYNGAPAGYTSDPQEVVTYVEKHDNETLFDISNYKNRLDMTMADRVRVQNMGISVVALSQGVPFFHAGMELMRSKSMDRNSFNSGDYYNAIDWTGMTNNFKKGLPQEGDNNPSWSFQKVVLDATNIDPSVNDIMAVNAHMREMLAIRKSSPLFRLRTAPEVEALVSFFAGGSTQTPGLIAMGITDGTACPAATDIDPSYDAVFVVFNANDEQAVVSVPGAEGFVLHPDQVTSADTVVQGASFDEASDAFTVPGRTTAVFVIPQNGGQGAGLPCNPYLP